MLALILIKIAPINLPALSAWEYWAGAYLESVHVDTHMPVSAFCKSTLPVCTSVHECARLSACACYVGVCVKSMMPLQRYSGTANAVPDHGVNNLIFNDALHYAKRSHVFLPQRDPPKHASTHSVTVSVWREMVVGGSLQVTTGDHICFIITLNKMRHFWFCSNISFTELIELWIPMGVKTPVSIWYDQHVVSV